MTWSTGCDLQVRQQNLVLKSRVFVPGSVCDHGAMGNLCLHTHTQKKNVRIYKKSGGGEIHIFVCIYSLSTSLREYLIWLMLLHPFKVRKATGNSSRYKVL